MPLLCEPEVRASKQQLMKPVGSRARSECSLILLISNALTPDIGQVRGVKDCKQYTISTHLASHALQL